MLFTLTRYTGISGHPRTTTLNCDVIPCLTWYRDNDELEGPRLIVQYVNRNSRYEVFHHPLEADMQRLFDGLRRDLAWVVEQGPTSKRALRIWRAFNTRCMVVCDAIEERSPAFCRVTQWRLCFDDRNVALVERANIDREMVGRLEAFNDHHDATTP